MPATVTHVIKTNGLPACVPRNSPLISTSRPGRRVMSSPSPTIGSVKAPTDPCGIYRQANHPLVACGNELADPEVVADNVTAFTSFRRRKLGSDDEGFSDNAQPWSRHAPGKVPVGSGRASCHGPPSRRGDIGSRPHHLLGPLLTPGIRPVAPNGLSHRVPGRV